jgi:hypothetical protein
MRPAPYLGRVALAVTFAACADFAGDDGGFPDGAIPQDATVQVDAAPAVDARPPGCEVVLRADPSQPVVGDDVTVTATIERAKGPVVPTWTVRDVNHVPIEPTIGRGGESIAFRVTAIGTYQVRVDLGPDSGCWDGEHSIAVRAPDAARAQWWLQVVFPDRLGLPPHEERVWVESSGVVDIGVEEAIAVDLPVVDATGAAVPAVVRWSRLPGVRRPYAVPVESATDDTGRVRTRLRDHDDYEVLIVPRCADGAACPLAPTVYRSWAIDDGALVVVAGQELTGTVRGPGGGPLAGARVVLTVDGVPSTIATTAADGSFAVRSSRLGRARVVVAPDGGGLPRLEASLDVIAGEPITVRYAALATRALTGAAIRFGGEAYAGARLTVVADIAAAGTIGQGAASVVAPGRFVASQVTGPDRALLALVAPAVPVSVVLEPVPPILSVIEVDLAASAPAAFDAVPLATLRGRVSAPDGGDPGPVRIRAVPTGALAAATGMAAGDTTGATGGYQLLVAAGGTYELVASDPGERFAEARRPGAAAGTVPDLALRAAVALDGSLRALGSPVEALRGASIALRCLECTGPEASRAVAVTLVGSTGRFRLMAPDPGVAGAGRAP